VICNTAAAPEKGRTSGDGQLNPGQVQQTADEYLGSA
jgi:hypothetical protein